MKRVFFSLVISLALLAMALPVYADTVYIVKPGETLSQIATRLGVSVQAIVAANGLANPNLIWVGQRLVIPAPGTTPSAPIAVNAAAGVATSQTTYRVQSGDTLYKICRQYGVSLTALMAANGLTTYTIFVGQALTIPAAGSTVAATPTPVASTASTASTTTAAAGYTAQGLHADYFYVETNHIGIAQQLWFDFKVTNSGGAPHFGILSIFSNVNLHGNSWTNSSLKWAQTLEWRDHIEIGSAGTYPFYLAICYADQNECNNNAAVWERLSDTVWVTVGDPTASTGYTSRGVVGNYFYVENMTTRQGDPVWFDFKVTNTGGDEYYGILSAQVKGVKTGQSWTNNRLKAGEVLEWRDHFSDLPVGTFAVSLGICYSSQNACAGDGTLWERLSEDVIITVRDPNQ
jgi:LysM repeat protein